MDKVPVGIQTRSERIPPDPTRSVLRSRPGRRFPSWPILGRLGSPALLTLFPSYDESPTQRRSGPRRFSLEVQEPSPLFVGPHDAFVCRMPSAQRKIEQPVSSPEVLHRDRMRFDTHFLQATLPKKYGDPTAAPSSANFPADQIKDLARNARSSASMATNPPIAVDNLSSPAPRLRHPVTRSIV